MNMQLVRGGQCYEVKMLERVGDGQLDAILHSVLNF